MIQTPWSQRHRAARTRQSSDGAAGRRPTGPHFRGNRQTPGGSAQPSADPRRRGNSPPPGGAVRAPTGRFGVRAVLRRTLPAQVLGVGLAASAGAQPPGDIDWPVYLGTGSSQYSALSRITRDNVDRLEVAWTYNAGDADTVTNRTQMQTSPIVVEGVLYGVSPVTKVFALDADTGVRRWEFDPFANGATVRRGGVSRGVTWWADGDDRRIFASGGAKLFALDADTGVPVETFGDGGSIDLHDGLDAGRDVSDLFVISNTPGVVYRDLLILPTRNAETNPAAPGNIRAFGARTGEVRWVFRTIPHPGELGHDTWPPGAWLRVGAANNWAGMSVDHERGLVFVPTGSATPDFYGGDRVGANLFANTLLALDAATGERVWHFQAVHHDIWDRDFPAPPNLLSIVEDGRRRDVVAQITKSAHVFVFDRETGEPIHPIEERPFPPSDIPGEVAWPTQPLPVRPPPVHAAAPDRGRGDRHLPRGAPLRARPPAAGCAATGSSSPRAERAPSSSPASTEAASGAGPRSTPTPASCTSTGTTCPGSARWSSCRPRSRERRRGPGAASTACTACSATAWTAPATSWGIYPAVNDLPGRLTREEARAVIDEGRGYMPSHAHLSERERTALLAYLYDSDVPDPRATVPDAAPGESAWVFAGYRRFLDQAGRPAIKPPWATLNAIDLAAGEILWKVTLGDWPELSAAGRPPTGAEAYGGPLVTASGLIFIGATRDERFRVFDTRDGELLWETGLPAAGYATPITYAVDGRQYVVIAAGGGKIGTKSGDAYVAFALGR